MYFVKPIVIGPAGHGAVDPDRRNTLPVGKWRAVPENPYWLRLHSMGDVMLTSIAPPVSEMEGYEPPAAEPEPAPPAKSSRKGSDA